MPEYVKIPHRFSYRMELLEVHRSDALFKSMPQAISKPAQPDSCEKAELERLVHGTEPFFLVLQETTFALLLPPTYFCIHLMLPVKQSI